MKFRKLIVFYNNETSVFFFNFLSEVVDLIFCEKEEGVIYYRLECLMR